MHRPPCSTLAGRSVLSVADRGATPRMSATARSPTSHACACAGTGSGRRVRSRLHAGLTWLLLALSLGMLSACERKQGDTTVSTTPGKSGIIKWEWPDDRTPGRYLFVRLDGAEKEGGGIL